MNPLKYPWTSQHENENPENVQTIYLVTIATSRYYCICCPRMVKSKLNQISLIFSTNFSYWIL